METSRSQKPDLAVRIIGAGILLILLLAFIALYIYPDHTDQDFAWTIKPSTTAILIGAGYMAGAYFFVRVILAKKWQHVQAGFRPITVFTIFMLVATLLHWDRFHQGTFLFYFWTAIYVLTPLLVPLLWWRNRGRDSQTLEEKDLVFPMSVRWMLGGISIVGLILCFIAFILPTFFMSISPWKLTELTARIFAGWSILAFSTLIAIAYDGRWSAARILLQSFIFGQVLTLLAMPRIWNDLDQTKPMSYVFVAGVAAALITLILIYLWLDRQSRRSGTLAISLAKQQDP